MTKTEIEEYLKGYYKALSKVSYELQKKRVAIGESEDGIEARKEVIDSLNAVLVSRRVGIKQTLEILEEMEG